MNKGKAADTLIFQKGVLDKSQKSLINQLVQVNKI